MLQILEKECPRACSSRETVYLPSYIRVYKLVHENRRTQLLLQESLFYYVVLQIAVSITISVIDTIWLSMFRRKFIFFSQGSSLFVVRNVGNTLLDQSLLSSFSSQNILHRSTVSNTVMLRNIYLVSLFSSTFFLFFFFLARALSYLPPSLSFSPSLSLFHCFSRILHIFNL